MVAAGAKKDPEDRLLTEYGILTELYESVPNRFPRPFGHYRPEDADTLGDLLVMERLPHKDINRFRADNTVPSGFNRDLSERLGYAITEVIEASGRFMSDPHDGNVMVKYNEGDLNVKFCDAIQFLEGDYETGIRCVLDREERPESYRFIKNFRRGCKAYLQEQGLSQEEAENKTRFIEDINPIF